jgi:hypothetical protein
MKIKTTELTGAALDWAVAKSESYGPVYNMESHGSVWQGWWERTPPEHRYRRLQSYSTDWSQGGPIIDREGIFFSPLPDKGLRAYRFVDGEYVNIMDCWPSRGPVTRLIAAMRCYVASKLGDEVDVPDTLV